VSKTVLMQGNQACALGAIHAGVRFFAGYPITPSTEVAEIFAEELPKIDGRFIQMEDEIASMGAVLGASLAGVKAVTATSGPGFSLKQELIGFGAAAEIPAVVVNVQRVGPSTGQPTSPAQGDVMQARWGSHGDRGVIALSPGSVLEAYTLMVDAVNLSERFRTPVIFLMDEVIGHMRESVTLPNPEELKIINRRVLQPGELPYRPLEDGVPPMAVFGEGFYYHVTGLIHDETGFPSGKPEVTQKTIKRLHQKIENNLPEILRFQTIDCEDADYIIIAYGGTARSAEAALTLLKEKGQKVGLLRLMTIWPFPYQLVSEVCQKAKKVIFPEMNYGQLVGEAKKVLGDKVIPVNKYDGEMMPPEAIVEIIEKLGKGEE